MSDHVLSGLIKKRAELAGKIEATQIAMRQLVIDLDHVDATIRVFDPDIDLEDVRPKPMPPRHSAFRGEVARIVLSTLRQSRRAITTKDLAMQMMAERGLNTADARTVKMMVKRVGACLRNYRQRGMVKATSQHGQFNLWELSR